MKVRKGFVTNSSSSSFIVVFDNKPNSVDDVLKTLFFDEESQTYQKTVSCYDRSMSTLNASEIVFRDIQDSDCDIKMRLAELIMDEIQSISYWQDEKLYGTRLSGWLTKFMSVAEIPESAKSRCKREAGVDAFDFRPDWQDEEKEKMFNLRQKYDGLNHAECEAIAVLVTKRILLEYHDKFIFVVTYSDEGGEAIMEHGDVFHAVPHMTISHH